MKDMKENNKKGVRLQSKHYGMILISTLLISMAAAMICGSVIAADKEKNPVESLMQEIRNGGEGKIEDPDTFDDWTLDPDDPDPFDPDTQTEPVRDVTSDTEPEEITTGPEETTGAAETKTGSETDEVTDPAESTKGEETKSPDTTSEKTENTTKPAPQTEPPVTTAPVTEPPVTTVPVTEPPVTTAADTTTVPVVDPPVVDGDRVNDPNYFKDALFIGDSRTVGFHNYCKIEGATYFARTSANVSNLFDNKKSETESSGLNLTDFLSKYKFGKIYILLGINEIGYSYDWIINNYKNDLAKIRQLQPNAIIIIQSNMHVTKAKSDANPNTFSNTRINELNKRLSKLADNKTIFYVDISPVFDDASGNMNAEYSGDGVHLKGKYYPLWKNFILEHGKR